MGQSGRPKAPLVLTEDERRTLSAWTRKAKTAQRLAMRARIILRCAEGLTNRAVAAELGIGSDVVSKWRGAIRHATA
jgi:FixJ family two-component response regulator